MAGGNSVIRVEKSSAMRCLPMPTMTRQGWSSEAIRRAFGDEKGMTFEGFFIEITWAAWFGWPGVEKDFEQESGLALSPAFSGVGGLVIGGSLHSY